MNIYFATTENALFTKSSKLADFSYSIPKELSLLGHDVRVVMPLYSWISKEYGKKIKFEKSFYLSTNGVNKYVGIFSYKVDKVLYYFIDNEYYFSRESIDSFYDDGERFGYFSRALLELLVEIDFVPDIIHLNDWHTAISATLFKDSYIKMKNFYNTKIIFTIHSLKSQGVFKRYVLKDFLPHESSDFLYEKLETGGEINFMKGGLDYADLITTGSKSYANEIIFDESVGSLQSSLEENLEKLIGIENGINYQSYNPASDNDVMYNYSPDAIEKRMENKVNLQETIGLSVDKDIPLIAYIGDLVNDKGIDLISFIFDEIMEEDIEFIILGRGDEIYENEFLHFSHKYRNKVSANIFYSGKIAKKIYASADIILMPSRIEPSGMGQLIAMRYGCIPVVRRVGGLKDTVIDYDTNRDDGTGFVFENYNAHEFLHKIKNAINYYKDDTLWYKIIRQAMRRDSSWVKVALRYEEVYGKLMNTNF